MAKACRDNDGSSDEEFPSLDSLTSASAPQPGGDENSASRPMLAPGSAARAPSIRRRKLGQLADNALLRPWGNTKALATTGKSALEENKTSPNRSTVRLRARKPKPIVEIAEVEDGTEENMPLEEVTFVEEVSVDDEDESEFEDSRVTDLSESDDESEDTFDTFVPRRLPKKIASPTRRDHKSLQKATLPKGSTMLPSYDSETRQERGLPGPQGCRSLAGRDKRRDLRTAEDSLPAILSQLCMDDDDSPQAKSTHEEFCRPSTPPLLTSSSPRKNGLVSPTKAARIPTTPHRPSTDMFWSQEFVNEWNDEHSPKKQLFPDTTKSPSKTSSPSKRTTGKTAAQREAKKAFSQYKHATATAFLAELDATITEGRLSELAASTGGIKLNWTNKLNTTAGRANWKRETVRTKPTDDGGNDVTVRQRHHASIDLAEKVIDDEHRLLNVVAHEFCHLANFMITGVTGNPHGREFKAWAARCSAQFGHRGVEVTTRHSYDIDFRYAWQCQDCGAEFKRHSRSIDTARHRCGSCRGELRQTKPAPRRGTGAGGGKAAAPSEYQIFMKAQMKVLREENPGSPQKDIMKLVAQKWSKAQGSPKKPRQTTPDIIEGMADGIHALKL